MNYSSYRPSRRSFLKGLTVTTAGGLILPNILIRADDTPASRKLGVAAIGCGGKGASDLDGLSKGNEVVALCDVDENNLKKAAQKFPNAKLFRDFRKMLDEVKEIEAVDVAALDAAFIMKSLPQAYQISLTPEAERQYADLNKGVQVKIDDILDRLRNWPQVSGVVALWGAAKGHFRMKTLDWRVIFHVDESERLVTIDAISHRKDAYGDFHGQSRKG